MAALQSHQEHLLAPQKFSLRPSAADENIFARVREARALHHDQPRGALLSPLGETLTSAQNPYTPEPLVPLCGSGEGLPPLPASLSSGALTAMRLEASRSPPPNPLEAPAPPRDRSVSPRPPSPPPAQPKSAPSSPRPPASTSPRPPSEPRPINNTTRKRRPPRAGTRSASPNAQDGITPPPSRPNSYGSTAAILSAVMRNGSAKPAGGKSDEQPKQVTVSPRRPEQSALVDQMVVSASGGALAGGSVRALLEWAVKTRDLAAQADLLFTFRLCAPAEELFAAFCDMAADTLYRTRLLEFLRLWLSGYFVMDFRRKTLFSRMLRMAETMLAADEVTNLKLLCLNANFRFSNTGVAALRKQAVERMLVAKGGLLHSQQLAIDSVPEKVLAEQLTSISSHLFRNICASELVEWILRGNRAEEAAPHITEILAYSARLSAWVTTEAVKGTPLSRLVGLGQRLQVLGNFEALRAVLNGLQHRAVVRLAAAWQALPADGLAAFDALEDLLSASGNFQLYRQTLTLRANQPTVPVLSICLHDLTVAYQRGAQASLLPNGMLSAAFVARLGNPLRALFKLQRNEPYTIVQQPALINWLLNVKPMDDSELAALAPQPLQSSGGGGGGRRESIAGGAAAAEAREEAAGGNAKGLKRALSARSLNRFLADLIYRTDEPEAASGGGLGAGGGGGGAGSTGTTTTTPNNASPLPPKDKDRVTQP